jgi:hypothetical protein
LLGTVPDPVPAIRALKWNRTVVGTLTAVQRKKPAQCPCGEGDIIHDDNNKIRSIVMSSEKANI